MSATEVQLSGLVPMMNIMTPAIAPWPLRFAHLDLISPELIHAITSGTAVAICDGSHMPRRYPHLAAVAWILHSGTTPAFSCHSVMQVDSQHALINSY